MTVATFVQPDATTQTGSQYKASIDGGFAVHRRLAGPFAPHAAASPSMRVALDPGHVFDGSAIVEVAAQTSTLFATAVTQPRIDRVVVDCATGAVSIVTGLASAAPAPPAIPTGRMPIAQVRIDPGTTAITNTKITDERVWAPARDAPAATRTGVFSPAAGVLAAAVSNLEIWRYEASLFSLAGDTDTGIARAASNQLALVTAGSEAMRIDHVNRVLIGGPSTDGILGQNLMLQIQAATLGPSNGSGIGIQNYVADGRGPLIYTFKSRSGVIGAAGIVQNGDVIAALDFGASDGAVSNLRGATIRAIIDDAPAANTVPTRLEFATAPSSGGNATARLIIDRAGNLVPGANGLATTAAAGFLWIESGAGTPTGVPSPSYSNRVPLYYDRTNNRLYAWNGAWRSTPLA